MYEWPHDINSPTISSCKLKKNWEWLCFKKWRLKSKLPNQVIVASFFSKENALFDEAKTCGTLGLQSTEYLPSAFFGGHPVFGITSKPVPPPPPPIIFLFWGACQLRGQSPTLHQGILPPLTKHRSWSVHNYFRHSAISTCTIHSMIYVTIITNMISISREYLCIIAL